MPTSLPRVNVVFEKDIYGILEGISKAEHASLSHVVSRLVTQALELSEDLALGQTAEERLSTFNRDDALTGEELIRWNRGRKKAR